MGGAKALEGTWNDAEVAEQRLVVHPVERAAPRRRLLLAEVLHALLAGADLRESQLGARPLW